MQELTIIQQAVLRAAKECVERNPNRQCEFGCYQTYEDYMFTSVLVRDLVDADMDKVENTVKALENLGFFRQLGVFVYCITKGGVDYICDNLPD